MRDFSQLLDGLVYTRSRNAKLKLIADYLRATADPDRGWAMAALTGAVDLPGVKASAIKALVDERVDPVLFAMSREFVGDLAETAALLWPKPPGLPPELDSGAITLSGAIERLLTLGRAEAPRALAGMLDQLDAAGRYALLKLATGELRVGVSARLAKTALAQAFTLDVDQVEEVWHGLSPPYLPLFAWATGAGARPTAADVPVFRPFMLAHPLEDARVDLADYAAEWKWDGIRVQLVRAGGHTRLYSRGGDDITASFPEVAAAFEREGVLDGELLVRGEAQGGGIEHEGAASFNALQQRLGRKNVSARMQNDFPAFVRLYDILFDGAEDLRPLGWSTRRARLEGFVPTLPPDRFDLSALIEAPDFDTLETIRAGARDAAIEGVMLKRRDSPYVGGRRVGLWYKWKRDPLTADCVMMYAQRGHGKRSSYYSDYTFGCWTAPPDQGGELLPVGKAYSGFTDDELKWLDHFVRTRTTQRFGPVREVEKSLVLEVAFDSIHESKRHKSGLGMRFPRIARIRRDKPAGEADLIATLRRMVT
ncbi:cisplatin damage response ATP-dependent DNA ligase [Sphingomonas nostoxanthinifaciens]|uniref:cisplatin damage response ATP-dependent DNA ligase n=1 Tax=Sphingomonas nostoxanthinifaciens TaxID=2872652 RepID=UPI001CC214D3|nr:cisplatin damage response ATP-dependent DNA ligase [Sphingomonas nostoxanthinifaciens]UAK24607.1 cisplatin damage response ATP-dependent DNA ligase [Sphingomonas nostoxanthinifaciens]